MKNTNSDVILLLNININIIISNTRKISTQCFIILDIGNLLKILKNSVLSWGKFVITLKYRG